MIIRNTRSCRLVCLLVLAGALFVAGCSKSTGPKTVRAGGVVTYKGVPVAGAHVSFLGDGTIPPAMALTEANGEFTLTTSMPGDGAVPGNHQVTVTKMLPGAKKSGPEDTSMEAMAKAAQAPKTETPQTLSMLPEKYASATSSGLSYKVEEGKDNNFKIELQD